MKEGSVEICFSLLLIFLNMHFSTSAFALIMSEFFSLFLKSALGTNKTLWILIISLIAIDLSYPVKSLKTS